METTGVERLIAHVLFWGGLVSAGLVLIGLALYLGHGGVRGHILDVQRVTQASPVAHPPGGFVSPREVFGALFVRPLDPVAVIALGLVLLLVTPILGVSVAIPAFLKEGDRRYAGIALLVLSMLLLSLLLAGETA